MKLPEGLKHDYMYTVIMVLVVLLIVFIFWFGMRFVFRTEHPILAVASGSMEPVLYEGDLILVEGIQNLSDIYAAPEDADPPGDIRVYQGPRDLIVHRAIEKKTVDGRQIFITHGDANQPGAVEHVDEDSVVGRYTGVKVPLLGHVALFFNPLWVKVAFIGLWIIALIIVELVPLISKSFKRDDTEESLYK
jgi:signal peptidase I